MKFNISLTEELSRLDRATKLLNEACLVLAALEGDNSKYGWPVVDAARMYLHGLRAATAIAGKADNETD